jgi:1,4-alpha-glucan branching enzyme
MGFTHMELMPVSEHPFDGSWGYQPIGLYAPTARFGDAAGFGRLHARCHAANIGLILDWVPAHFPSDAHGLGNFDGTHLYEYADPREGFPQRLEHPDLQPGSHRGTQFPGRQCPVLAGAFRSGRLRVDAVASMLYRDYSRKAGEWIPNTHGGRENLEAIDLPQAHERGGREQRPQAITLAEESTAFPAVSRPTYAGGLGFHYKWNMGWMHDTLAVHGARPIAPQVPSWRDDFRPGLRLQRKLCAAALAR